MKANEFTNSFSIKAMEKKLAESIKMAEMQRKIQREKLDMVRKNNELNLERQRKVN